MSTCKKEDKLELILGTIMAGLTKQALTAPTRKKKGNPTTKPVCLTLDGTLYRIIIVITCEKGIRHFIKTKEPKDKHMLDTRTATPVSWESLTVILNSEDPALSFIMLRVIRKLV